METEAQRNMVTHSGLCIQMMKKTSDLIPILLVTLCISLPNSWEVGLKGSCEFTVWNKKCHTYHLLLTSEGEETLRVVCLVLLRGGAAEALESGDFFKKMTLSQTPKSLYLHPPMGFWLTLSPLMIHWPSENETISRKSRLPESPMGWLRTRKWASPRNS